MDGARSYSRTESERGARPVTTQWSRRRLMPSSWRPGVLAVGLLALLALAPGAATALGSADGAVAMVAAKKIAKYGQPVTFTITVTNLGPDPTTGVSLGVGVSDSYENTGPLICPDGNPADGGFCTLATLAPGASVAASYVAIARNTCCPEDQGVAVASVNSETIDASDPVASNNEARVETPFKGKPRS
jgi:hypothetical protein